MRGNNDNNRGKRGRRGNNNKFNNNDNYYKNNWHYQLPKYNKNNDNNYRNSRYHQSSNYYNYKDNAYNENFKYYNNNDNYIENLKVEKTQERCVNDYIENPNFGFEYQDSICTKSYVHLKIKSINEKSLFTAQYNHFFGLKILLIKREKKSGLSDYIKSLLDEGKYKVIPFSNDYTKLTYNNKVYYISYNSTGVRLVNDYYRNQKLSNVEAHNESLKNSRTSYSDTYIGTFNFHTKNDISLDLIIYESKCEIDGIFEVFNDIKLDEFKAENIVYANFSESIIKSKSLLIYEIKSGDQKKKLEKQMIKRAYFIINYLKLIYDMPIYYFGFYKENPKKQNILLELEENKNAQNKNDGNSLKSSSDSEKKEEREAQVDNLSKNGDNKNDKNKINEDSVNENNKKKNENSEENISSTNGKSNDNTKEEEKKDEEEKEENESQRSGEDSNKTFQKNDEEKLMDTLPAKIAILELKDSIFGEYLKYDKEDLNILGNLSNDVTEIKERIKIIDNKLDSFEKNFKIIDNKLDSFEENFQLIFQKLGIPIQKKEKK